MTLLARIASFCSFCSLCSFGLISGTALADQPSVAFSGVPTDQDTSIVIHKGPGGNALEPPDYRIDSGSEEISGDPVAGQQASYASWKSACADWKKDMREMNGKTLISLSCGVPKASRDAATSQVTQTSIGTYKLKIRVRDTSGSVAAPAPVPAAPAAPAPAATGGAQ